MTLTYDIQQDLDEFAAMVDRLETFLYVDDVYGDYGLVASGSPTITIGGIRLRLRRLLALQDDLANEKVSFLKHIISAHDNIRLRWRNRYEVKTLNEINSRLRLLETYLRELDTDREGAVITYRPELLRRTIIEELVDYLDDKTSINSDMFPRLNEFDENFKHEVEATTFQWDEELAPIYPQSKFWWLYSQPVMVTENG